MHRCKALYCDANLKLQFLKQVLDIMLAEDNFDDVAIFEMALQDLEMPYTLRHAKDGEILFVLLQQHIPDILFLDIHMPCRDGVACIAEIRKDHIYDKMPIIMYTSNLSDKVIAECLRNGANRYLSKTNAYGALVKKLKKVLVAAWPDPLERPSPDDFVV